MPQPRSAVPWALRFFCALTCVPAVGLAQGSGTVTGTVTRSGEGSPLASVTVTVQGTSQSAVTGMVKSQAAGDQLLPNTPSKKVTLGLTYAGSNFDANATLRMVDGYQWAAGVFQGYIPASEILKRRRGLPAQQQSPDSRHGHQCLRPGALPALRRVGASPAGVSGADRELLGGANGRAG